MDTAAQQSAKSFLRRWAYAYEALVARVLKLDAQGDDEVTLRWLALAASIAWAAHPGRFADERLEAVGLRAGQRLRPLAAAPGSRSGSGILTARAPRRVLHVATTIYDIGGHTRLIENWIKKDEAAVHSLMLLDQRHHRIRDDLAEQVAASGGELMVLPADCSLLDKARRLRRAAQAGYDFVVLHHHPNDVVPLVALSTVDCPPVAIMNHADHVFWLGVSVADAVIDFREFGARMSRDRRGARQSLMFPLPLDLKRPALDRTEARVALGIPAEEVMLLSIGSAYKYRPTAKYDFFRTLRRVLAVNPKARLYLIGISADELRSFGALSHDRVEPLGVVSDPSVYEAAADLYLEGFPLNSYTALLETAARGVCPVLMYAPTPELDLAGDAALKGLVASAKDEDDYVARVTALIDDSATRMDIGQSVGRRIASINGGDIGRLYLQPVYERLAAMKHQPAVPPAQGSEEMEEDLNLASFHGSQSIKPVLARGAADTLDHLRIVDLLRVLAMSVRIGDTRARSSHVRTWLGLLRRKLTAPRHTFDTQK